MSSAENLNKKSTELTKKQAIFVKEYLTHFNGTKAAVSAGYSKKGAEVAASRLLRDVKVAAAIDAQTSERCDRLGIEADQILKELGKLAFANMMDYIGVDQQGGAYIDFSALTRDQAAAIHEVTSETYSEPIPPTATGINEEGRTVYATTRTVKRTKFKLADKRGALDLLGRHLKLFSDRVDLTANLNGSIKLDPTQRLERLGELLSRAVKGGSRKSK